MTSAEKTHVPVRGSKGPDLLTIGDLIEITGWGRTFVYQAARTDTLPIPTLRVGRKFYFSRAAYERWLSGQRSNII